MKEYCAFNCAFSIGGSSGGDLYKRSRPRPTNQNKTKEGFNNLEKEDHH